MSHLYVATNGLSVWSSADLGETLLRMSTGTGLYSAARFGRWRSTRLYGMCFSPGPIRASTAWTKRKKTGHTFLRPRTTR